ncbi:GFA family protein [Mameliella sediminis]|uniref:GFA family protein n=1 Tax=Mameliella sediminis TaxID=2836866 RepID=UPI001C472D69|nr:GFA family protein [Mameliella sediminis]MBY6116639.1 GFA family protein [Antarctobacter heliothermus]MBY6146392.1 GFA family protein [Mameliella alba]MBV7396732.1 GFA family protein [Mameliella sediminis]MBY6163022.1 GFA family protein [Mameliella alba]MBY6171286.1 GFA family protein [Mameliella alba]
MAEITGRCLCGHIRYRAATAPVWTALCHCDSCRRACSAPVVAWMGFATGDVTWTGTCKFYQSSRIATRGFCPECGTQMSFESTRWPGEIHLYGVSRDDPQAYAPDLHCHHAERLDWLTLTDDLRKCEGSAELN